MNHKWEELIVILEKMLAVYQAILTLSKEKRAVLVAADGKKLEQITKQEEILILNAGKLDARRAFIVKELGAALELAGDDLTIEKLSKKADPVYAGRLKDIKNDFDKTIAELTSLNRTNSQLIQHALNFVNYNINILVQNQSGPTYAPKGRTEDKPAPPRALFDRKV